MSLTEEKLYRQAYWLSLFTIFYNILEGLISMILGYKDETLTLFGFGADSFIEVISGFGIAMMIIRIKRNPESPVSKFETRALRITGFAFYMLAAGLLFGIITNLIYHHKPENTIWGVVISLISIVVMIWLLMVKKAIGKKLNSAPIIADANCTKICIYMSLTLLASSLIYKITGFSYIDSIGAVGLIYFSINEGKEAFENAKTGKCSCGHDCKTNS
ncbi:MAG: cation transporter [Bacteroidetes bacterium]|nr:cation transporter [Bacteroidota bacterium]